MNTVVHSLLASRPIATPTCSSACTTPAAVYREFFAGFVQVLLTHSAKLCDARDGSCSSSRRSAASASFGAPWCASRTGTAASVALSSIGMSSLLRNARAGSAVFLWCCSSSSFSSMFIVFTQVCRRSCKPSSIFPLKWLAQGMRSVFLPESFESRRREGRRSWQHGATAIVLAVWAVIGTVWPSTRSAGSGRKIADTHHIGWWQVREWGTNGGLASDAAATAVGKTDLDQIIRKHE